MPEVRAVPPHFAHARAALPDARFVLGGAPYDRTCTFRAGARLGPAGIRQASWSLASWSLRTGVDAAQLRAHDAGDADVGGDLAPAEAQRRVAQFWEKPVQAGKFPVLLGGEHTGSAALAGQLRRRHPGLRVLVLDAHLDWRADHEGEAMGHRSTVRRIADHVGAERVAVLGVRSAERGEAEDAQRAGVRSWTSFDVERKGISRVAHEALAHLGPGPLHLSLDMDVLDPAHAPGTGTPEPYGLAPQDVLAVVQRCAPRLAGLDVMEVSPPWDSGITAALAARLVRDAMDEVLLAQAGP